LSSRPRILMVGPWPPATGGVATFISNVVNSALKERYDFVPFTTARPTKVRGGENFGYRAIFRAGFTRLVQGIGITIWHLAKFPFVVLRRPPALVQVHASDFLSFWEAALYVIMARMLRRPVVLRIGGHFNKFWEPAGSLSRAAITCTLNQPTVLIAQSEYWRSYHARIRKTGRIVVLNNFVPDEIVVERTRAPAPILRFLLYVGEIPQAKGAYVLLDALRLLAAGNVAVQIVIVGATQPFREHVESCGFGTTIELRGFLTRAEMLAEMRRADVYLQISLSEGFPNTLLEAMASGCALIVTPVGAIPEAVGADGCCASVIPAGDPQALAASMTSLVQAPQKVQELAAAARARVLERFTERSQLGVLDRMYGELTMPPVLAPKTCQVNAARAADDPPARQ
jgi:glycosyltransferase involved in cell wall biosynthesis